MHKDIGYCIKLTGYWYFILEEPMFMWYYIKEHNCDAFLVSVHTFCMNLVWYLEWLRFKVVVLALVSSNKTIQKFWPSVGNLGWYNHDNQIFKCQRHVVIFFQMANSSKFLKVEVTKEAPWLKFNVGSNFLGLDYN